jgi:SagB-type dehydrogenase family enzyme
MTAVNEAVPARGGVTETLVTHAAVRLARSGPDEWIVVRLDSLRRLRVNTAVAAILVAHAAGWSPRRIHDRLVGRFSLTEAGLARAAASLRDHGMLVTAADPGSARARRVAHEWGRRGWRRAADYYLATFDYPFVDYAQPTALPTDRARMIEYIAVEPDTDRTKSYPPDERTLPAVEPTRQALRRLAVPLPAVLSGAAGPGELTAESVGVIMSIAFGRLRARRLRMPGRAPLIRRTSPSGGSRHPTEGYVLTEGVSGIADGTYHFATEAYRMHRLTGPHPIAALTGRSAPAPAALILMTSVFERNMYRYREPRTFRTVHMDVGHIVATLDVAAAGLGLATARLYDLRHADVERLLGLHPGQEGSMVGVLIGEGAR